MNLNNKLAFGHFQSKTASLARVVINYLIRFTLAI